MTDKFNEEELLQIIEWMVPNEFRQKFDKKGYIPTNHDRKTQFSRVVLAFQLPSIDA